MGLMNKSKNTFETDLVLGERYRESGTGITGKLTSLHFYEYACERATLRYIDKDGNVQEATFDAPELVHLETGQAATSKRPGGPARNEGRRTT